MLQNLVLMEDNMRIIIVHGTFNVISRMIQKLALRPTLPKNPQK